MWFEYIGKENKVGWIKSYLHGSTSSEIACLEFWESLVCVWILGFEFMNINKICGFIGL